MSIHFIKFHIGDFLSDTVNFDATETGAYFRLLLYHYKLGEQGIPNDEIQLSRIAGCSLKVWNRIKERVLSKFTLSENFFSQKRVVTFLRARTTTSSINQVNSLKRKSFLERIDDRNEIDSGITTKPLNHITNNQEEKESSKRKKSFTTPTHNEISEYCLERNNHIDAEKFYDHYESNGWHVGKNKMKDWKAAIRTWEKSPAYGKDDKQYISFKE